MKIGNNKEIKWTTSVVTLLIGIILILVSIIADIYFLSSNEMDSLLKTVTTIISKGISAVGISLVVGFITAKIHKSEENSKKIYEQQMLKDLLQQIVISKDFIYNLSSENKEAIIKNCLVENDVNPEMINYILYKINKLQETSNCTIRSNIDYITTVSKENNSIISRTTMSYRIFPHDGKYSSIDHCFEKASGRIISMKIIPPQGDPYNVPMEKLQTKEETRHYNDKVYTNSIAIPSNFYNEDYLTLKIVVEELGYDHWIHLIWMSLYPTDTISYKIICKNNLIIKDHMIFDNQKGLYYVEATRDDQGNITEYTINCDKWTDPYTGFSLVISEP